MGKDLRESSEVVGKLWDRAEKHFLRKYGLSLMQICDENPIEKTVHFGGVEGARMRQFYRDFQRRDHTGELVPMFPQVQADSTSYTFQHDQGLLFATQFAQPLLVLTEMAQYLDLKAKQLVPPEANFAGHSLGEYAA